MNTVSKHTRELYRDIRSEFIKNHLRLEILRRFFNSQDTVDLLNKTAPIFFDMLKYAFIDMIVLSIQRLNDPPKSKKSRNASLAQLIQSLDTAIYSQLVSDLNDILGRIRRDSQRIRDWRNKWVGHRDYNMVIGQIAKPAISLEEIDKVLSSLGEFLNKFEQACYDPHDEWQMNHNETDEQNAENFREWNRLRINPPTDYVKSIFLDDSANLLRLIEQNQNNSDDTRII